jgi:2-polyprenyl-3-methyl-5-hydroxy-6-metoxy-1,4-benzoquinol methylase
MKDSPQTAEQPDEAMHAKEAGWYNEFYGMGPLDTAPWNRYLLPFLIPELKAETRLLELGCGQGQVLRVLAKHSPIREENIFGIDQSEVAVEFTRKLLPRAGLSTQDIYQLNFAPNQFDVCVLMETIEHLEEPVLGLKKIATVTKPGGLLFLSFPNYAHLPWLVVRILAEKLNRPNWVVLQPVDKIYTTWHLEKLAAQAGYKLDGAVGSNYGPPVFYPLERDWLTRGLNKLGLWRFSYHPILKFRKVA